MTDILPEIDDRITELEERLGQLRRRKRAIVGGRASGDARQRHDRNEQIRAYFRERPHSYGALTETAHKFGLSTKQVGRILRAKIATESSDCSDPNVDLSVEESNGQPGRLASPEPRVDGLSPAEVASTVTESIGPGFAPDPRMSVVRLFETESGVILGRIWRIC